MMPKSEDKLSVFWGEYPLGTLEMTPGGRGFLDFSYCGAWLDSGGPPVSMSLPLSRERHDPLVSTNFFDNYLPEGEAFGIFHLLKHIPPGDVFRFLYIYGRECAGALSVLPFGEAYSESEKAYRDVTDLVTAQLELPARQRKNLIAATDSKVSLAGAQNKLPVVVDGDRLLVPAERSFAATTHIIKAPSCALPDLQYNEAFCMDLVRAGGLSAPESDVMKIGGTDVLIIERYDRYVRDGSVRRLHQEDFCQALGLYSKQKYEQWQGPGFATCAGLIGRCTDAARAIEEFARFAVFNLLVGNGDAHGKNFSVVYEWAQESGARGKGFRLAPFYDVISTLLYADRNVDTAMAMRFGKSYRTDEMNSACFRALAKDLGIDARRFRELAEGMAESIGRCAPKVAEKHASRFPSVDIYGKLLEIIEKQTAVLCKSLDVMKTPSQSKPNRRNPRPR
ncbi:MAG: type II toxin-antitoxin system HipA family toxin [Deltaproteobacteria bacterium]|nr:type II toxin-antitoxin system HipA family toxin [Deltaproteobacteria bacterium]